MEIWILYNQVYGTSNLPLLLDSMAEDVFTLDPDGTIISWNPAMKKITGYGFKNACVFKNSFDEVVGVVETIMDLTELIDAREKTKKAELKITETHYFSNIIGKSRKIMRNIYKAITAAGKNDATILIQVESGTGKELMAGAIHFNSACADAPLGTVNCRALSESLLESELFGNIKGAFTGAHKDRKG